MKKMTRRLQKGNESIQKRPIHRDSSDECATYERLGRANKQQRIPTRFVFISFVVAIVAPYCLVRKTAPRCSMFTYIRLRKCIFYFSLRFLLLQLLLHSNLFVWRFNLAKILSMWNGACVSACVFVLLFPNLMRSCSMFGMVLRFFSLHFLHFFLHRVSRFVWLVRLFGFRCALELCAIEQRTFQNKLFQFFLRLACNRRAFAWKQHTYTDFRTRHCHSGRSHIRRPTKKKQQQFQNREKESDRISDWTGYARGTLAILFEPDDSSQTCW